MTSSYNISESSTGSPVTCQSSFCSERQCADEFAPEFCYFEIGYGDKSKIAGMLTTDFVTIIPSNSTSSSSSEHSVVVTFGEIMKQTNQNAGFENSHIDGILGLAYGHGGTPVSSSLLYNIIVSSIELYTECIPLVLPELRQTILQHSC